MPALDLDALLAQALARKYPASPYEAFFTGGGVHSFENFDPDDNGRVLQVHEALAHSTSLVLKRLLGERVSSPRHLAMVFFAWHSGGDAEGLQQWSDALGHPVTAEDAAKLVRAYGSPKLTLLDYGYLLGRHPLEVWCAGEMSRTPAVTWDELVARSSEPRRLVSTWLFQERQRHPQDLRVRIQMEQDAF